MAIIGAVAQSLARGPTGQASVPEDDSLQAWNIAFNILSALGFFLLTTVFLTALCSSRVKRVSTWYTYIVAWMVFCVPPFLIIGHQTPLDPPPSFAACVVDSALMYASRPFAAFATLALLLHLYLNVSTRLRNGQVRPEFVLALIVIPPISYLGMLLYTLLLGIHAPDQVQPEPQGFYCHISSTTPAIVGAALVVFGTTAALLVEVLTVILLWRNWCAFRALQRRDEHAVSLSIIIRISVFGTFPVIGLILSFTTYTPNLLDRIFPVYNIILALLPVAAGLIFGSQMDLIKVWMFWRAHEAPLKTEFGPTTSAGSGVPFFSSQTTTMDIN
ncbi:hypothetical protein DFH07DRAFT_352700 [Mycena maculata]|uniref:Uncharacterized protein n=1 Tax=Mycena maculata TaxID=230809 RepID=A0AAD7JJX9_9AGAR|nr:hypothetical protein DFH07DRAFT_352700 [Mycena maculata]